MRRLARGMMSFVRAAFRLIILVLIVGVGGGSALLDGCLVSCHPGAATKNARTGHCHTVASPATGSHLESIPHCCHELTSGVADTSDIRSHHLATSSVALTTSAGDTPALSSGQFEFARHFRFSSVFNPIQTPLRL